MELNKNSTKPVVNKQYEIRWRRIKLPWICHTIDEVNQTANLLSRDRKSKIKDVKWDDLKLITTP